MEIKKVGVVGAGLMGTAIAMHIANAKIPVILLNIPHNNFKKKLTTCVTQDLAKPDPLSLIQKQSSDFFTYCDKLEDLEKLKNVDWIIETVSEDIEIKKEVYRKIEDIKSANTIVSSNTSTLPLSNLLEGANEDLQKSFLITHFFYPPRHINLLEIVKGSKTSQEKYSCVERFATSKLDRKVMNCYDTPGFIANRLGVFLMYVAIAETFHFKLSVEETDFVVGQVLGMPRTGIFGAIDMSGLDLFTQVGKNIKTLLPINDSFSIIYKNYDLFNKMIARGYTGIKGKGGFYRVKQENGKKVREVINLENGEYYPFYKPDMGVFQQYHYDIKSLVDSKDKVGMYVWNILSKYLSYAISLVPEVSSDIRSIDEGMKQGYKCKRGPFEILDDIGPSWFASKLTEHNLPVPVLLRQIKERNFSSVNELLQTVSESGTKV